MGGIATGICQVAVVGNGKGGDAMTDYGGWAAKQTPERRARSVDVLSASKLCGEAQRRGDWADADRLSADIRGYYESHKDNAA